MTLLWWRVLEIRIYERISSVSDDDVISDAEVWCFLWPAREWTVEQKIETPVIWEI